MVERCVNDLVLVDNALDKSMLDPKLQNKNIQTNVDDQASGNHEIITGETQEVQEITDVEDTDKKKKTETSKANQTMEDEKNENNDGQSKEEIILKTIIQQ